MGNTIYVVRHGQTDWNKQDRFQGKTDIPLNATGRKQAEATSEDLHDVLFDAVYCSPLVRARETCEIILKGNKFFGGPTFPQAPLFDNRIMERDFGDMEGKDCKEYPADYPWWNVKNEMALPHGETIAQIRDRVTDFWNDLERRHKNQTILVVAHGGVLRILHFLHNPAPANGDLYSYVAGNASVMMYKD